MKSDSEIKRDIEDELQWDPDIDATDIAVLVNDGVAALTGFVSSYAQKFQAEADAKRVAGVVGVANDIEVRVPALDQRPDPEIARDAVEALKSKLPFSSHAMKVTVHDGWITLEGEVEWNYQRERAEDSVRWIKGVKGVVNSLDVKPKAAPTALDVKHKIEEAFRRSAEIDAGQIQIETNEGEVVLKGTVHSWFEREQAERAAWSAPGVRNVIDQISIRP